MSGDWLLATPQISFFELVRLLLSGGDEDIALMALRFASHPGLGHARRDVEYVDAGADVDDGSWSVVAVNFFGLLGVGSPLPANLLESLSRQGPHSLASLLISIIDDHLLRLLYRQWWGMQGHNPAWTSLRQSLQGTAHTIATTGTLPLWYCGCGSASAVVALLGRCLPGARVVCRQWLPRRLPLSAGQCARLGCGFGLALGSRTRVIDSCAQIDITQLDMDLWSSLLPGGSVFRLLQCIRRRLLPALPQLQVRLQPAVVDGIYRRSASAPARLGQSLWLQGGSAQAKILYL